MPFMSFEYLKEKVASPTLISPINVALQLYFLGKNSRPYAVIKDPLLKKRGEKIIEKLVETPKNRLLTYPFKT